MYELNGSNDHKSWVFVLFYICHLLLNFFTIFSHNYKTIKLAEGSLYTFYIQDFALHSLRSITSPFLFHFKYKTSKLSQQCVTHHIRRVDSCIMTNYHYFIEIFIHSRWTVTFLENIVCCWRLLEHSKTKVSP